MRVAVVVNPTKLDDAASARARAQRWLDVHAPGAVLDWYETTREDPGTGQARAALGSGADVVLAWGGDGTVRSVAAALADQPAHGPRAALGLLPGGTGNLLARNLALPLDLDAAAAVALTGGERAVDVLDLGLGGRTAVATVIAGIGLDSVLSQSLWSVVRTSTRFGEVWIARMLVLGLCAAMTGADPPDP